MKTFLNPKDLPLAVGLMGIGGALLRLLMMLLATDRRGLIQPGHILVTLLWVVTALTVLLVTLPVRKLGGSRKYSLNFSASRAAAFGCGVMALCLLITTAFSLERSGLGYLRYGLGLAAGSCLIFLSYGRFRGINVSFLFHCVVCTFFAIHMVSRYRVWSGDPQLLDYVFEVFACVGLMLFAYQQAAFELDMGNRRKQLCLGLLTAYFCLTALPRVSSPLLYLGGAVWTLTNLCTLTPPPRRKRAAPEAPRPKENETA